MAHRLKTPGGKLASWSTENGNDDGWWLRSLWLCGSALSSVHEDDDACM